MKLRSAQSFEANKFEKILNSSKGSEDPFLTTVKMKASNNSRLRGWMELEFLLFLVDYFVIEVTSIIRLNVNQTHK